MYPQKYPNHIKYPLFLGYLSGVYWVTAKFAIGQVAFFIFPAAVHDYNTYLPRHVTLALASSHHQAANN